MANIKDFDGYTALLRHVGNHNVSIDVILKLMDVGGWASILKRDKHKRTILHKIMNSKGVDEAMVAMLIAYGVDENW